MVFGESPLKDLYRRAVWGPWRELWERAPAGLEYRANWRLGWAVGHLAKGKHREVREVLADVLPGHPDLDAVVHQSFGAHFANQYASFAFGRINRDNWRSYLEIEGLEAVEAAVRSGEGLVLMHPHMGPAQLPLCVLGVLGYPMHQVGGGVTEVEKSPAGQWAASERARLEQRMPVTLHDGKAFLRGLLRALGKGEVVLTACDGTGGGRELGRRYVRTVLGRAMKLPVAAFYLAHRTKARLHPLHTVRDGRRWRSVIGPELPVRRELPLEEALEAGADETAAYLDAVLKKHPGDWLFWDQFRPGALLESV